MADRYLWGPMVDQLLADEQVSEDLLLWALGDNQNTIRDVLTYNSGTNIASVSAHIVYDAFGNVTDGENPLLFGYTGKYFEVLTGLQYNMARWYNPATGRWISEDPIGFVGDPSNLGRYVGNGPTNGTDPRGLWWEESEGSQTGWPDDVWDEVTGIDSLPVPPGFEDEFETYADFEQWMMNGPNSEYNGAGYFFAGGLIGLANGGQLLSYLVRDLPGFDQVDWELLDGKLAYWADHFGVSDDVLLASKCAFATPYVSVAIQELLDWLNSLGAPPEPPRPMGDTGIDLSNPPPDLQTPTQVPPFNPNDPRFTPPYGTAPPPQLPGPPYYPPGYPN